MVAIDFASGHLDDQPKAHTPESIGEQTEPMAKNTGDGSRRGAVKGRVQALNPITRRYVKIDTETGRIIDHKKSAGPYKGVREVSPPKKPKK